MITQEQYLVLQHRIRRLSVKIELLNNSDIVIDTFEGYSVSGSINLDSESDYRRTGSLKMVVTDDSLLPKSNSKIWFNRKVKVYVGLEGFNEEKIWFRQGIFVIQSASVDESLEGVTLDISLSDLMSLIDGKMNGTITHELKVIPEGNLVSDEIRQALSLLGKVSIDKIEIEGLSAKVPYTMVVSPSSTIYEHVKSLLDLYYGMEMFYNEDGFLIIRKIRDRRFDPIVWNFDSEGMNITLNSSRDIDFTNVRNAIYLWGKKKDTGETTKWFYRNRYYRDTLAKRNAIDTKIKGDICHVNEDSFSYVWDGTKWDKLDFTVSPQFNVENIGEKVFSYTDESIVTLDQARLRAEFELKKRNHLAETISFSCVPVYGLNPNEKIHMNNKRNGIEGDYLVNSISFGLSHGDSMSVQARKIYY